MDLSRLSTTTYPLIGRPLEEALDVVAAAGFKKVDLLGRKPHFSLDPAQVDPAAVEKACAERGLEIANLATYCGVNFVGAEAEAEQALDDVRRTIDLAVRFGARTIRVFRSGKFDDPQHVPALVPWLKRCAEYGESKGVAMGIENHGGGISGNAEVLADLCRAVGSEKFGVLYDPCNLLTAGADWRHAFEVFKDHIVHVHVKDGTSQAGSPKSTMLGEGEIDVAWLLDRLGASGYEGDVALEYEVETVPPDEGLKVWRETFVRIAGEA